MEEKVDQTQEKEEKKSSGAGKVIFKYTLGILIVALGLYLAWSWRADLLTVIKGCLGLTLVLAGFIAIAIAKE